MPDRQPRPDVEWMDLDEFRNLGFLQEVNRCFLHPLGLALAVDVDDDGSVTGLAGIIDSREDPEGFVYGDWPDDAQEKAKRVREELRRHTRAREKMMAGDERTRGLILSGIQPVGWLPPEEDDGA